MIVFPSLKSPWTSGHSRAVADLARAAAGPTAAAVALVHDLGRVAVPSSIWDRPGPLSRDERDRADENDQHAKQPEAALVENARQGVARGTDTHRDLSLCNAGGA